MSETQYNYSGWCHDCNGSQWFEPYTMPILKICKGCRNLYDGKTHYSHQVGFHQKKCCGNVLHRRPSIHLDEYYYSSDSDDSDDSDECECGDCYECCDREGGCVYEIYKGPTIVVCKSGGSKCGLWDQSTYTHWGVSTRDVPVLDYHTNFTKQSTYWRYRTEEEMPTNVSSYFLNNIKRDLIKYYIIDVGILWSEIGIDFNKFNAELKSVSDEYWMKWNSKQEETWDDVLDIILIPSETIIFGEENNKN